MQNNNKLNKEIENMGKKEKLKNNFDELFGSLEHYRFEEVKNATINIYQFSFDHYRENIKERRKLNNNILVSLGILKL